MVFLMLNDACERETNRLNIKDWQGRLLAYDASTVPLWHDAQIGHVFIADSIWSA